MQAGLTGKRLTLRKIELDFGTSKEFRDASQVFISLTEE